MAATFIITSAKRLNVFLFMESKEAAVNGLLKLQVEVEEKQQATPSGLWKRSEMEDQNER